MVRDRGDRLLGEPWEAVEPEALRPEVASKALNSRTMRTKRIRQIDTQWMHARLPPGVPWTVTPKPEMAPTPARRGATRARSLPSEVRAVVRSPGQPLERGARNLMEARFRHSFADVRVHADERAAASAQAVGARAYALGRHLVFGPGEYRPHSRVGQALLAHELAHAVQQRGVSAANASRVALVGPSDPAEAAAVAAARAVVGGEIASLESMPPAIARQTPGPANQPRPQQPAAAPPEEHVVDREFWIVPPGVRPGAMPIYDDQETHAIVGFRYTSGGFWQVYDLNGNLVETGEAGLEQPLIDPIDIFAGLLTGLVTGVGRSGVRMAGRVAASAAGEAATETGIRGLARVIGQRVITAIRATYRAIRLGRGLNFTGTTAAHMAEPGRRVPIHILNLAIRYGARTPDPQGVAGAFRYVIPMFRNGRQYTLEVVLREADRTILHFLYR